MPTGRAGGAQISDVEGSTRTQGPSQPDPAHWRFHLGDSSQSSAVRALFRMRRQLLC